MENWPFRELGGNLMWLPASTRPGISNAVGTVERYGCTPRAVHLKTALGILAYIKRPALCSVLSNYSWRLRLKQGGIHIMIRECVQR